MRDRDPQEENEEVFKKARLARPQLIGRAERTEEYVSTAKWRERRWPACRSSGAGTAAFFNTLSLIPVCMRKMLKSGSKDKLVPDRRGRPDHSPSSSFIPQAFSNQRKLVGCALIQQSDPTQVAKKCFEP